MLVIVSACKVSAGYLFTCCVKRIPQDTSFLLLDFLCPMT